MPTKDYIVAGLTHVDLAWKNDSTHYAECMEDVAVRVLDLAQSDPSFTYVLEQVAHLRALAERRPDLIERLRPYVEAGRIEVAGGMASSLDTNGVNGESYVRNHLVGRRWAREHLGAEVLVGELIDTFGISAQTPQIHRQFGLKYLLANRLGGWPHEDVFLSRGIDGSTVLMAGRDNHSPYVKPGRVHFRFVQQGTEQVDDLFEHAAASQTPGVQLVVPYTENARVPMGRSAYHIAAKGAENGSTWRYGTLTEFFRALESTGTDWPIVHGDLNPTLTGCYGLRPFVRMRNRKLETLLLEAEKWAALRGASDWERVIEDAWWTMSYIQSHDVYSGSFPTHVRHEVVRWLDSVERAANDVLDVALGPVADRTTLADSQSCTASVFNGLPWQRRDVASMRLPEGWTTVADVTRDGASAPFDVVGDAVRILADVPAVGSASYVLTRGVETPSENVDSVTDAAIENEHVRVECRAGMGIERIVLKDTGETLSQGCGALLVAQHDDGSFQDSVPVHAELPANVGTVRLQSPRASDAGSRIVMSGEFPNLKWARANNKLAWKAELSLRPGAHRIDVTLALDWIGEASRVGLHLPTTVDSAEGIYEIPFGTVRRKPYGVRDRSHGEWPAFRFAAVEDGRRGVALVNTGTMGVEVAGGSIRTTLFRAPARERIGMGPDDTSSQHGRHTFAFAIVPYAGTLGASTVLQDAQEVNTPLLVRAHTGDESDSAGASIMSLSPSSCVLSAVKRLEDNSTEDIIVRLYESVGEQTTATVTFVGMQRAWLSNLLEEKHDELDCADETVRVPMKPFEIKTLRIQRMR